jgi:ELWxxDGT repeat protein
MVYGNKLYFNATTAASGDELWVHNGTTTTLLADIEPGTGDSSPKEFAVFDGKLCFGANNGPTTGTELYSLTDPNLGVNNIKFAGNVLLSPNPTAGNADLKIMLTAATSLRIELTDISGKLSWSKTLASYPAGETVVVLPMAELASGTYFYRLADKTGTSMASGKVIRQ